VFDAFANVVSSIDRFQDIQRSLQELAKRDVLIGIPQEESSRPTKAGESPSKITNAELAYIHTHGVRNVAMRQEMQETMGGGKTYSEAHQMYVHSHGSPLMNVPARPIIEPAIEAHRQELADLLKSALMNALDGRSFEQKLKQAGMKGQSVTRAWFTDPRNGWAPNSPITIKLKSKKGRGIKDRPLIDEGELRKSITYVVRDKE
jgi:hypothetical protein